MRDANGKVLELMWDPKVDTVELVHSKTATNIPSNPLAVFEKQFPTEIKEVRYLALPTTLWAEGQHSYVDVVWPLIDFTNLQELAVVLDDEHEKLCLWNLALTTQGQGHNQLPPWTIPEDLETNVDFLRNHYEKFGPEYCPLNKKPTVRVVCTIYMF
jgi:hypothetical protein